MDAFDRFWQWADKPLDSPLTIPAELHRAVRELAAEERYDRAKVNAATARFEFPLGAGRRPLERLAQRNFPESSPDVRATQASGSATPVISPNFAMSWSWNSVSMTSLAGCSCRR